MANANRINDADADRKDAVLPGHNATDVLQLVGRIASSAIAGSDSTRVLQSAVREVGECLGWTVGHAYRVTEDMRLESTSIWWRADHVSATCSEAAFESFRAASDRVLFASLPHGLPERAMKRREPVWIRQLRGDRSFRRQVIASESGLESAFIFPVMVGDRVVAVLEFFASCVREPDPFLIEAATTIGAVTGGAFDRWRGCSQVDDEQPGNNRQEQLILDNAGDAYVAIDDTGAVIGWNRESERLFGYSKDEAMGHNMATLVVPEEYRADHYAGIERFKKVGVGRLRSQSVELEALRSDGTCFPLEMTFWGVQHDNRWYFYSFGRDITERKTREAELVYWNEHDELTGLPNRSAAMTYIAAALDRRAHYGRGLAIVFMDLDRFKITKERLGPQAADELLQEVAARVTRAAGASDWVARVADDEFVIVREHVTDPDSAVATAERILEELVEPIKLSEDQVGAGASIGIVVAQSETDTAEDLLRDASAGISVARYRAHGQIKVFDETMRDTIRRRLNTERDLTMCVERDELRLHYQPIIDLPTGRIVGVEALVRWQHPQRGLLPPGAFIDIAEETGLIIPIGTWVLREAVRQAREWQDRGWCNLSVAVNLSARQFTQSGLVDTVAATIKSAALDVSRIQLELEVTETLLMNDPHAAVRTLEGLHDLGLQLSIDDFGTGYSSLAYLKSFPVDTVKIDRSFVTHVDTDPSDRAIVTAVTELGHALGLEVLAEGIETTDQHARLIEIGCDLAQGYLFGKPAPADEITALLRQQHSREQHGLEQHGLKQRVSRDEAVITVGYN